MEKLLESGCSFIKTVLEDGFDPSTFGLPKLSQKLLHLICEAAHNKGAWVSAHVSQAHNLEILVDAGVNEAAHNVYDPMADSLIEKMVSKDVYMIPTMNLYRSFCDRYGAPFYDTCVDNLTRFIQAGGKIALGTDYMGEDLPWFESGMPLYEMKLLRDAGLSITQIIAAATGNAAKILGISGEVGTIEAGKTADLIVAQGDVAEDLEVMNKVVLVMKNGIIIRNDLSIQNP